MAAIPDMVLHLLKLSVGCDSMAAIAALQAARLAELKRAGRKPELVHVTRQMPKRAEELLDGGSLFWVSKGWISARQRLLELRPMVRDGVPHCGLVLGEQLVAVQPRPYRAFQGWRYFEAKDAPPDSTGQDGSDMPEAMRRELISLGLL